MLMRRGFSLIATIFATSIVALAVFYFGQFYASARKIVQVREEEYIAGTYAAELLEFFRSLTGNQLKTYLSENPFKTTSCPSCAPYFLCSHINLLDRNSGVTVNEDPLAALPPTSLDGKTATTKTNRYYQVQH